MSNKVVKKEDTALETKVVMPAGAFDTKTATIPSISLRNSAVRADWLKPFAAGDLVLKSDTGNVAIASLTDSALVVPVAIQTVYAVRKVVGTEATTVRYETVGNTAVEYEWTEEGGVSFRRDLTFFVYVLFVGISLFFCFCFS